MTAWFILNMSQDEMGALALGGVIFFLLLFGVCEVLKLILDKPKEPPNV